MADGGAHPEPDVDLIRVQWLIWILSLVGIALPLGFFWVSIWLRDPLVLWGMLTASVGWFITMFMVIREAERLTPEQRVPAKGVPVVWLAVWALAEAGSWSVEETRGWIFFGHLLIGGTVALRGLIALGLDVPVHRRTLACSLAILGVATVGQIIMGTIR